MFLFKRDWHKCSKLKTLTGSVSIQHRYKMICVIQETIWFTIELYPHTGTVFSNPIKGRFLRKVCGHIPLTLPLLMIAWVFTFPDFVGV